MRWDYSDVVWRLRDTIPYVRTERLHLCTAELFYTGMYIAGNRVLCQSSAFWTKQIQSVGDPEEWRCCCCFYRIDLSFLWHERQLKKTVIYIMVLMLLNDAKTTLSLCCCCLGVTVCWMLPQLHVGVKVIKQLFTFKSTSSRTHDEFQTAGCCLSSVLSKIFLIVFKGNEDYVLGRTLCLSALLVF